MSQEAQHCVIVGAGHAAAQLAGSLRSEGWQGAITVFGDEPELPYHRPPLSKAQLDPELEEGLQLIKPAEFYAENQVTMRMGERVDQIDRSKKQVTVGDETLDYDVLVLSTGSVHRLPPIEGIDQDGVMTLRTAEDARRIKEAAQSAKRAVVVGAGFIGLEVAASLRKRGVAVSILELAPRVLSRVASPEISHFFEELHRQHDVDLRTGVQVSEVRKSAEGYEVLMSNGDSVSGDFVIMGTGAAASSALAEAAGLDVDNGILVNEFNQTSDPDIYAMGDCCNQGPKSD